jgi:hypothetical protein
VTPAIFLGLVPVLFGLFAAQSGSTQQSVSRLVVQDELILRVPVLPRAMGPQLEWVEKKGPRCIPAAAIRRALLSGPEQVDFILVNRTRVRARLEDGCPALDFYGGFYLQPEDWRVCADRDEVHSRMGGSCTIERFRQLVPRLRD